METTLSYLTLAVSAATLVLALYVALRIKSVLYLLHQPVVKKMSPQLRLKPVKLDEALDRNRNRDRGPGGPGGRDGRDRDRRDDRRPERSDRPEGAREAGREGRDRRDGRPERGERPEGGRERGEGDRNRGRDRDRRDGRPDRPERRDGDRRDDRRPPREFSETRDFAPPAQTESAAPVGGAPSVLPARRPLSSFADSAAERPETSEPARDRSAAETFVGNSDDVQHGRRTQLKKKPRFDFDEEETAPPAV